MSLSKAGIAVFLRERHSIVLGEKSLRELRDALHEAPGTKVRVSGRSLITGRKKSVYEKIFSW